MSTETTSTDGAATEVATSLSRGTNWWGAFVIGLAGTILVTGIVPFAVSAMGAAAIPAIALVVVIGMVVCLCMGELAAMFPHRTGGMPSYAYESFKPLGENDGPARGGRQRVELLAGMVPGGAHQHDAGGRLHRRALPRPAGTQLLDRSGTLGSPVSIGVLLITIVGLVVLFIPCYLGIRLGATFATMLGITSMVPLTLLVFLPAFKPRSFHWANVSGFHFADPKTAGAHLLHGLDLRHLVERHRHGGGRLLHRGMPRPRP